MDAEEYRRQYEREIAAAQRAANPAASMATRELVAAIKDTKRSPVERKALIAGANVRAVEAPSLMNALIRIVGDPHEDSTVRLAAMKVLQQNSFNATGFRRYDADYREALRTAATDDDPHVRDAALEPLAHGGDEYAQRLLVQGLEEPKSALVPAKRALQMLSSDVHAEQYPVLRDLVTTSKQQAVRRSALRLLAADSDAADLFASIAADKSEDPGARATSAVALQSLAPEQFHSVAHDVVLDDDDNKNVRATFANAITHGDEAPHPDVDAKLRSLAAPKAPAGPLRAAARQYVAAVPQRNTTT